MKTLYTLITLTIALLFNQHSAQAQNGTDSLHQVQQPKLQMKRIPQEQKAQQRNYYKRTLKVDSLKAEQVAKIQQDYKAGMKTLQADQSLNQDAKIAKIKALMEEKNSKLEAILDASQQSRIIPPGEPRRSRTAVKESGKH